MTVNGSLRTAKRGLSLLIAMFMLFGLVGSVTVAEETRGASDYYLVGTMNGWDVDDDYKLTLNTGANGVTEYWITLNLEANTEFKVTKGDKSVWYPYSLENDDRNYKVTEDGNYTVYFRPDYNGESDWYCKVLNAVRNSNPVYEVIVSTDGEGSAVATGSAVAGETVTVTITPDEGWAYDYANGADGWSYNAATGIGTFTMPAHRVALFVAFKQIDYTITVNKTGNGNITVAETAHFGDSVTLTAEPAEGSKLKTLTVDGADVLSQLNDDGEYTFSMPSHNVAVEAQFLSYGTDPHTITVVTEGLGTAYADKTTAVENETVTITTEGSIGYAVTSVDGLPEGAVESDGVYTFEMPDEDVAVTFRFERMAYAITLDSAEQGTMNAIPRTNEAFAKSTVQIIVNADEGYIVEALTVTKAGTSETVPAALKSRDGQTFIYEFTMPSSAVTVKATYKMVVTAGYYLIGNKGWGTAETNFTMIDPNARFTQDPNNSDQWILKIALPAGCGIKAVKVSDTAIETYYPDQSENCTVGEAGTYLIYFRPGYGGGSNWFKDCLRLVKLDLARDYYLINLDGTTTNSLRTDDKLYINKDFDPNTPVTGGTLNSIYGITYEHMVLTWLNSTDKIKVVRVENGSAVQYYPDENNMPNHYGDDHQRPDTFAYPDYRYYDSQYAQDEAYDGMVFVFFEEQLGNTALGGNTEHAFRRDWTNLLFDVQKAYKVDMDGKDATNPLNAEALTYNLAHGSVQLSTGTAFVRESRPDETNIIYELSLGQRIYCTITPEKSYSLVGTPYVTYDGANHDMTRDGDRWYFVMPSADVTVHAPMCKVFRTQSALLSGKIGVNFFVDLSNMTDEQKNAAVMKFYINNVEIGSDTFDPDVISSIYNGQNGKPTYHGFTCFINALQMADTITAVLEDGSGNTISEKTYSLEQYVTYFDRADSTQNSNTDALRVIRATLDFGYYMQQLQFKTGLADENSCAHVSKHYATKFDYAAIQEATKSHSLSTEGNKDIENSAIKDVKLQLAVDSATALILNLYMHDGWDYENGACTITVGGTTLAVGGEPIEQGVFTWSLNTVTVNGKTCYQVRIAGISAHDLNKQFNVTGDAGGSFTITASAFSYVNSLLKNADIFGENAVHAKNAAAAIYQLHEAEVTYRTSIGMSN